MPLRIFTTYSPQKDEWSSRYADVGEKIGGSLVVFSSYVGLGNPPPKLPRSSSFLSLGDRSMYCCRGRLYQSLNGKMKNGNGKNFVRVKTSPHCGIRMFSFLGDAVFVLLLHSGEVRFGSIWDNSFTHQPCSYEDQINSYAPVNLVRFSGGYDHCCSVITRKGEVVFLQGELTSELTAMKEVVFPNVPTSAIFADRIAKCCTVVVAERWTARIHNNLNPGTKRRYHRWLLTSRKIGLNFILFLQIAEII